MGAKVITYINEKGGVGKRLFAIIRPGSWQDKEKRS